MSEATEAVQELLSLERRDNVLDDLCDDLDFWCSLSKPDRRRLTSLVRTLDDIAANGSTLLNNRIDEAFFNIIPTR